MPFVTAGYPTPERSEEWVLALVRGGADIIEIGVPFSDPLADGATVQRTSQAALRHGVTLADSVAMARRLREQHAVSVPILLMGYFNPMLQYGLEELARDSAAAGVDGYIVPDFPPRRAMSYWRRAAGTGSTWCSSWRRRRLTNASRLSPSAPVGSSTASH